MLACLIFLSPAIDLKSDTDSMFGELFDAPSVTDDQAVTVFDEVDPESPEVETLIDLENTLFEL